jgi:thiamine-phosphate pyrophosphorylase
VSLPQDCLCLVTARHRAAPAARTAREALLVLLRLIEAAARAGVDLVQVREPDLGARELTGLVRDVISISAAGPTRVVVNERADVALAAGAHGVHLRGDGPPAVRVRTCGTDWLVGRSVHPGANLMEPGLDYLTFGTIAPTASKVTGAPVAGVDALRTAVSSSPVPVLAIGGITPALAEQCAAVGAAGVAAIGAFLAPGLAPGALGAAEAVVALREALSRGRRSRDTGPPNGEW